ncbi:MAG: hypothetical protein GY755_03520 [Chloroflexi bacterium]|nr:hypothetical protein [Chloroflexota bacterium]
MSTKYQKKQQKHAKEIFKRLVIALLFSFAGTAAITFQWAPGLRNLSTEASLLQDAVALEKEASELLSTATDPEDPKDPTVVKVSEIKAEAENLVPKKYKNEVDKETTAKSLLAKLATFRYLAWVFAALTGASVYLIGQIATYYPKIKKKEEDGDKADFKKYTYWYASTFLKAPILALVVMWFLANLNINFGDAETTGVAIDFSKIGPYAMIGIAFVLGFYGRVARKQLDVIAKSLFTRAWALAEEGFELVIPGPKSILLNSTHAFTTTPPMEVLWSATVGEMNPEKGTYQAPNSIAADEQEVIIRASLRAEPASTSFDKMTLKAIRIKDGDIEIKKGDKITLSLETKMEEIDPAKAKWEVIGSENNNLSDSATYEFEGNEKGTYTLLATAEHVEKVKEENEEADQQQPKVTPVSDKIKIEVA